MHHSRQAKAEAIAKVCYEGAKAIFRATKELSDVSRKYPRIKSKNTAYRSRLLRRRRIGLLTASIVMQQAMTSMQISIITSMPIPKFKNGANTNEPEQAKALISADSTAGEQQQEYSSNPFASKANAIQPLPGGQRSNI